MIHDLEPLPVDTLADPSRVACRTMRADQAEFEDASRLEFMMAHPEDAEPDKVYLVDDARLDAPCPATADQADS